MTINFDNLASAAFIEALFAQWANACAGPTGYQTMHGWTEIREGFVRKARALLSQEG